jgi:hypothetical protein
LDIFEMVTNTHEPMKKFVNWFLKIFWMYQVDAKKSTVPIVGFLGRQVPEIIGFQIETKRRFPLLGIFTNLRGCHL